MSNRLLASFALFDKMRDFWIDLLPNFESLCKDMLEKFGNKEAKKIDFIKQMELCNKYKILEIHSFLSILRKEIFIEESIPEKYRFEDF